MGSPCRTRNSRDQLCSSFHPQSRIEPPGRHVLICLYALMIIVGSVGNLMVIYVVARNPFMRTARNVFIVNLAISDLMLCLITMPLTLVEILYQTWQVCGKEEDGLLNFMAESCAIFRVVSANVLGF